MCDNRELKTKTTDCRGLTPTTLPKLLFSREFRKKILRQKNRAPGEYSADQDLEQQDND